MYDVYTANMGSGSGFLPMLVFKGLNFNFHRLHEI